MFERFTERARAVVIASQQKAIDDGDDHIGTDHLLLGLVDDGDALSTKILLGLGVNKDKVRHAFKVAHSHEYALLSADQRPGQGGGNLPFTQRAKQVLECSLREALSLGHSYIGTEHILLALSKDQQGPGARLIEALELDPEHIRSETMRVLTGSSKPMTQEPEPAGRGLTITISEKSAIWLRAEMGKLPRDDGQSYEIWTLLEKAFNNGSLEG